MFINLNEAVVCTLLFILQQLIVIYPIMKERKISRRKNRKIDRDE